MNPFHSLRNYETFVYTLPQRFPRLAYSTLTVIRCGKCRAEVMGELHFSAGIRRWYDSQSHPNDPSLASTDPHHKHIPPDVKHHRIPAPDLSFTRPNLSVLIAEIERELLPT